MMKASTLSKNGLQLKNVPLPSHTTLHQKVPLQNLLLVRHLSWMRTVDAQDMSLIGRNVVQWKNVTRKQQWNVVGVKLSLAHPTIPKTKDHHIPTILLFLVPKANSQNPHLTKMTRNILFPPRAARVVQIEQRALEAVHNSCSNPSRREHVEYVLVISMLVRRVFRWRKDRQVQELDIIRRGVGIGGCGGVRTISKD
jgi:hypothetical protein